MTVVMSKLKEVSEHYGIPSHYVTRSISYAIFAAYLARFGYPLVKKTISNVSSKVKSAQDKISTTSPEKQLSNPPPPDVLVSGLQRSSSMSDSSGHKNRKKESF